MQRRAPTPSMFSFPFIKGLAPLLAAVLVVATLLIAAPAWARSGGSMGGGFRSSSRSFGGSSSRSFGGGSFGSGSRSSSPSSSSWGGGGGTRLVPIPIPIGGGYGGGYSHYGTGGYSSSGSGSGFLVFLLVIGAMVVVIIVVTKIAAARRRQAEGVASQLDVAHYEFGVQALARDMQDRLEAMAERVDTSTPDGLQSLLRSVALELRRHVDNIQYGAAELRPALAAADAERQFLDWTGDARSKYGREVVRADRMGVQRQVKEMTTDGIHDEDGQLAVAEYFVVTVMVAARRVPFVADVTNSQQLDAALSVLMSVPPSQLEAVEVVWSPASKSDAMDKEDMMMRYPRMMAI